MPRYVALLRGINVGTAKRIAMADLRDLIEKLGYENVRTLLNSGNVVFDGARGSSTAIAPKIEKAIVDRFGFSSSVVVLNESKLTSIIAKDPLAEIATDDSRHFVAFAIKPAALEKASAVMKRSWTPEALAIGPDAAYLWTPAGLLKSALFEVFNKAVADGVTVRNWATVMKIQKAVESA